MAETIHHKDIKTKQPSYPVLSKKNLQTLLNSMDGAIFCTEVQEDDSIRITYFSHGLFTFMRRSPSEVGAHGEHLLKLVYPDDYPELAEKIITASRNQTVLDHMYRVGYDDGSLEWRYIHGIGISASPGGNFPMIHLVLHIDSSEFNAKYQNFLDFGRMDERNSILSLRINLTTGVLGECIAANEEVYNLCSISTADSFFEGICEHTASSADYRQCTDTFSCSNLLRRFAAGQSAVELQYRSIDTEGMLRWLKTTVEMMKNPRTGEIEALLYSFDIDYEKNMSLLVDRLLDEDYEFLGLIDTDSGALQIFGRDKWIENTSTYSSCYDVELQKIFKLYIVDEYYDESIRTMNLAYVIKELKKKDYYLCSFPAKESEYCRAGQKQWKFSYLDSSNTRILMTRTDITDIYTAEYDPLTGLYNRQAFYRHVRDTLDQNQNQAFLMIRCDIDRFKAYNDTYGTQAGDRLLAEFGRTVRQRCWSALSLFSRIEADHFCIFMPVDELNTSVFKNVHQDWLAGAVSGYHLTTSIGIYEITNPEIDISLMCDRALLALNTVKDSYIGKIAWYDERLRDRLIEEQSLADEMQKAIDHEEFEVYLQPQIRYSDHKLTGMEALVRWMHPKRGMITPNLFIPLFEKNGFIMKLDYYVWDKSCAILRRNLDLNGPLSKVPISVNLSRNDLYNPDLIPYLTGLIAKYDLPAGLLRLEITESAYMDEPEQLIKVVCDLRNLGFTVEMDDFGTGYSSLTMLKDAQVDVLKLDMKFLNELESDDRGAIILASVIQLASNLHLPVIAEGVETKNQADYLINLGCDLMQGYYFSRPVPESQFQKLFAEGFWKPAQE